jgi:hypothetical protein
MYKWRPRWGMGAERRKKMFELHMNSITTSRVVFALQLFRFWIFGNGDSIFLMKGILFFLTDTILVPVEIELIPGFGSLPSPHQDTC